MRGRRRDCGAGILEVSGALDLLDDGLEKDFAAVF
jgi:hypothetical protein